MKDSNFLGRFQLLSSDISIAQKSFIILMEFSKYAELNTDFFDKICQDEFLLSTMLSHKITVVISLHKIFDTNHKTQSMKMLMEWVRQNKHLYSHNELKKRKLQNGLTENEAENYVRQSYKIQEEDFNEIFKKKRILQKYYEKNIKELRDKAYAHREDLTPEEYKIIFKPVTNEELGKLINGAAGLFEDLWRGFEDSRKFSLLIQENWSWKKIETDTKNHLKSPSII